MEEAETTFSNLKLRPRDWCRNADGVPGLWHLVFGTNANSKNPPLIPNDLSA